jgi:hypothetical protein
MRAVYFFRSQFSNNIANKIKIESKNLPISPVTLSQINPKTPAIYSRQSTLQGYAQQLRAIRRHDEQKRNLEIKIKLRDKIARPLGFWILGQAISRRCQGIRV